MDYEPKHDNEFYIKYLNKYALQFYQRNSGRWVCIPSSGSCIPPYYLGSCIEDCIDQASHDQNLFEI